MITTNKIIKTIQNGQLLQLTDIKTYPDELIDYNISTIRNYLTQETWQKLEYEGKFFISLMQYILFSNIHYRSGNQEKRVAVLKMLN